MLMFTKKHNELIEKAKEESYRYGLEEGKSIAISKLENRFRNTIEQYNNTCIESEKKNSILTLKVNKLEKQLKKKDSKEILRYELIAKRTKKSRIKEKAEKKILALKERKLYFE